jgi:hypothetical protein
MKPRKTVIALGLVALIVVVALVWRMPVTSPADDMSATLATSISTTTASSARAAPAAPTRAVAPSVARTDRAENSGAPAAQKPPATLAVAEPVEPAATDPAANGQTFLDPKYGVTGKIPATWTMRSAPRWGQQETTLFFEDPANPDARPSVYYRMFDAPMQLTGDAIGAWLQQQADAKAKARVEGGLTDYVNRDFIPRTINDRPALTWTAEFTRNGEPWVEYITRVYSPNCTTLFFLQTPLRNLPEVQPGFETVIKSTKIR